ncbi:MAG TPA: CapA family protein, partial [Candidatus Paceibacterota bacterium]
MDWLIEGVLALFAVVFGFIPAQTTAYYAPTLSEPQSAVVIFGGDMMFDRTIRTAMEEKGGDHIFSCIDGVLREVDMVVANLEGPITDYPSISQYSKPRDENNFTFTFPPSTAPLLFAHNIRLVNIGNNHIANFGREGMIQTKSWLDTAGVQYFGDPQSPEAERVARTMIGGIAFSFVNWSDWTPAGMPTASNGAGIGNSTVAQIAKEKAAGR